MKEWDWRPLPRSISGRKHLALEKVRATFYGKIKETYVLVGEKGDIIPRPK
jgi:hypothetical protein